MSVIGIRCSNRGFTYAVLTGSRQSPSVQHCSSVAVPKNFKLPRVLYWMVQEVEALLEKYDAEIVVMKGFEGRTKGKAYEARVELEASIYIAGGKIGMNGIFKKVKSTIAKDLGLKGRARYLNTSLDTSVIPGFTEYGDKAQEAILAGWSEL